jgi:hypothetical protein
MILNSYMPYVPGSGHVASHPSLPAPMPPRRFNASAPYNMTHISNGFIPFIGGRASEHTGIVFPIGLERFGRSDYIVSYGDSDQASKVLLISAAQVGSMLRPLAKLEERLDDYFVCALPCEGDPDCTK